MDLDIKNLSVKAERHSDLWKGLNIKLKEDVMKTRDVYLEVVKGMIFPKGVWPAIGTNAHGVGAGKTHIAVFYPGLDKWTEINIIRYPSRRTILELFSNLRYLEVMPYKLVGLRLLTVATTLRFQFPDLRLSMGTIFLITLLEVGWFIEC